MGGPTHTFDTFLFMSQVHMRAFSSDRPCQHNTQLVYLYDHGYNGEGKSMEEIPAGGCSYVYLVGDFTIGRFCNAYSANDWIGRESLWFLTPGG